MKSWQYFHSKENEQLCNKFISFINHKTPKHYKFLARKELKILTTGIFMFKLHHRNLPDMFLALFQRNEQVHTFSTRNSNFSTRNSKAIAPPPPPAPPGYATEQLGTSFVQRCLYIHCVKQMYLKYKIQINVVKII